jgi:hypothetical protein
MRLDITSETEFERLIEGLSEDLVSASIHFELYRDLRSSTKGYLRELNQSVAFWQATFRAHLDSTIFRLCRIYDQHDKALSLLNWLDTIKGNLHMFDIPNFRARLRDNPFVNSLAAEPRKPDLSQLQADIASASESNPLVKKLIILRGNVFAHKYAKNIMRDKDLLETYPLTWEEIQSLLETGLAILNRYSGLFQAQHYSSKVVGHDDYLYVLGAIRADLERRDAELQATMKRISDLETGQG